jgi:hypothetical protein
MHQVIRGRVANQLMDFESRPFVHKILVFCVSTVPATADGVGMSLRKCLREPIPEIEIAAHRVSEAVSAHLRGERDVAEQLLRLADDKVVWDRLDSVWGT